MKVNPGFAALLLLGVLAGCGGGAPQALSEAGETALHREVAQVRAAAERGDLRAADAAIGAFRDAVHRLLAQGDLDSAAALALLSQADQVGDGLVREVPAPVETVPAEPAPVRPEPRTEPARAAVSIADALRVLRVDRFEWPRGKGNGKGHGGGKKRGGRDD